MSKTRITLSLRARVMARDNHICRACGFGGSEAFIPFLDCDHIISESHGGKSDLENLQCLCKACNIAKAGNDWTFITRICNVPESIWAHNHKVMQMAFIRDTAQRLRKLK